VRVFDIKKAVAGYCSFKNNEEIRQAVSRQRNRRKNYDGVKSNTVIISCSLPRAHFSALTLLIMDKFGLHFQEANDTKKVKELKDK
jgi:aspartate/methionine/tyrosine aminotransferase